MAAQRKVVLGLSLLAIVGVGSYVAQSAWRAERQVPMVVADQSAMHGLRIRAGAAARTGKVAAAALPTRVFQSGRSEAWGSQFIRATDYLQFIKNAEGAARRGDGRAAYYISKALLVCSPYVVQYRSAADPQAAFQASQMSHPNQPQWAQQVMAQNFSRCEGLIQHDPFASLPPHSGGYTLQYWFNQAVADGDRVAEMDQASSVLGELYDSPSSATTETVKSQLQSAVTGAVESGDAHAMFLAGMMLSNAKYSPQPLEGVAIALAACDLGYDCSASNPENPFSMCARSGACPADGDFAYYMQQSLGAEQYAQAYSEAQSLEDMLSRNDSAGVAAITRLR